MESSQLKQGSSGIIAILLCFSSWSIFLPYCVHLYLSKTMSFTFGCRLEIVAVEVYRPHETMPNIHMFILLLVGSFLCDILRVRCPRRTFGATHSAVEPTSRALQSVHISAHTHSVHTIMEPPLIRYIYIFGDKTKNQ